MLSRTITTKLIVGRHSNWHQENSCQNLGGYGWINEKGTHRVRFGVREYFGLRPITSTKIIRHWRCEEYSLKWSGSVETSSQEINWLQENYWEKYPILVAKQAICWRSVWEDIKRNFGLRAESWRI